MSEFLAMGGHAAYIWPCYALAVAVMAYLVVQSLRSMRQNEQMIETLRAGRGQRRDRPGAADEGSA